MTVSELKDHLRTECEKTMVSCTICEFEMKRNECSEHTLEKCLYKQQANGLISLKDLEGKLLKLKQNTDMKMDMIAGDDPIDQPDEIWEEFDMEDGWEENEIN